MTNEVPETKNWWKSLTLVGAIAISVIIVGFSIGSITDKSNHDRNEREYVPPKPPEPLVIELEEDFNISIKKPQFRSIYNVEITYVPSVFRVQGEIGEITDVNISVSLISKRTVNVQRKTATVARWNEQQSLKIENFDVEIDGFSVTDFEKGNVGCEITGSAKSGNNIVKINQQGFFSGGR